MSDLEWRQAEIRLRLTFRGSDTEARASSKIFSLCTIFQSAILNYPRSTSLSAILFFKATLHNCFVRCSESLRRREKVQKDEGWVIFELRTQWHFRLQPTCYSVFIQCKWGIDKVLTVHRDTYCYSIQRKKPRGLRVRGVTTLCWRHSKCITVWFKHWETI